MGMGVRRLLLLRMDEEKEGCRKERGRGRS